MLRSMTDRNMVLQTYCPPHVTWLRGTCFGPCSSERHMRNILSLRGGSISLPWAWIAIRLWPSSTLGAGGGPTSSMPQPHNGGLEEAEFFEVDTELFVA